MMRKTPRGTTNRNDRGGSADRARRKLWLLEQFGDGDTAVCSTEGCDTVLDFDTITVDRYPIMGCDGGTYRRDNIRPMCAPCNQSSGGRVGVERKRAKRSAFEAIA